MTATEMRLYVLVTRVLLDYSRQEMLVDEDEPKFSAYQKDNNPDRV
jgi:hypothetical protein